jgi:adenosylcobinamide-phosphate synthase
LKFLSLLAALLLEQIQPLREGNPVHRAFERYASALQRQFDAGQYRDGVIAWLLAVVPVVLFTVLVSCAAHSVNPLLGWAWNIAVLYVTMGFRRFSHYFREIMQGLREGDLTRAREHLGRCSDVSTAELTPAEVARVSIELALVKAHRHVFGPLIAFVVLGPGGAMLYRISDMVAEIWSRPREAESAQFERFARDFFFWLDWLPSRLTAASFAIVGNFEDAVYCWRTQGVTWSSGPNGVLLASGGGAIGVRLGDALHQDGTVQFRPELGLGEEADTDYMQSTVGLLWRALVLWVFLIFIVTVAHSLG